MDIEMIKNLIIEKKAREFRNQIDKLEYVDIALIIEELAENYQVLAFRMLPKDCAADVFSYLPVDSQEKIISNITDSEISSIIEDLYVDDAVDMLDELPATIVKKVLANAKPETRAILNQFLKYNEDSAGSIMTSEYIDLKSNMNVLDAIAKIRKIGKDKEDIYTCYIIDSKRHLQGVVDLKDILLANDNYLISDLMDTNYICCKTSDDQESVSKLMQKYDLLALPVVDNESRLVGIITIDDAIDIIQEEVEEDFEKMAAMLPSEKPYLQMSVFTLYKNRIIWLSILMISGMLTGLILERFEAAISVIPLLVSFIPMLNDTGGNSGSQAATMCIRGLTTGEITPKQWLKVWWKEFRVSLLVSITLAFLNFLRIVLFTDPSKTNGNSPYLVALVVCGSLVATIILAKSLGALLPLLAKKLKLDPAVCASPLITTIIDCAAILIYFSLATTFLL